MPFLLLLDPHCTWLLPLFPAHGMSEWLLAGSQCVIRLTVFFINNKITEALGKVTDTTIEVPTNYHGSLNGCHQVCKRLYKKMRRSIIKCRKQTIQRGDKIF